MTPGHIKGFSLSRTLRRMRGVLVITAVLSCLFALGFALKLHEPLPLRDTAPTSRLVLDRSGRILRAFTTPDGRWRLEANSNEVSKAYLSLLFAFEDRRFYRHPGVDPWAVGRAAWQALRYRRAVSGGSTLTMQVARLIRGGSTRTPFSKLQQIVDALRLEAQFGKREILSLYLKLAPYGGNLEGVRAASLAYFGKEPARLTIAEAALLVAIPQSPETRRPDKPPAPLLAARNRVIQSALKAGVISKADADFATGQSFPRTRKDFPAFASHLAERLIAQVPDALPIRTTLDRDLQEAAESVTRRHVVALGEKLSIAALVVRHSTGEVLAHVGSAGHLDGERQGAIDMTMAIRSPGSALKPFIYGLAFEDGLAHPETMIEDKPARFDTYAPTNFDNTFHGTVSIRQALQLSLNVPAVKVLFEVTPAKLSARFREAGMPFAVPRNLTIALGGTGLTLEHLTSLYVALARGGSSIPLRFKKALVLEAPKPNAEMPLLLQPAAAWYLTDILRHAPAPPNTTPGMVAFKTGTSYGYRDAWVAGYDGDYTISVWVGRPDGSSIPGLQGLRAAAPVLFDLFGLLGPQRAPLPHPPASIVFSQKTADLPPPLRAFRDRSKTDAVISTSDAPLRISFPLANSEVELDPTEPDNRRMLALKAEGGTLPLTWLVNGVPLSSSPHRRDAFLLSIKPGFLQLTVVDANGRSDRAQVRLR